MTSLFIRADEGHWLVCMSATTLVLSAGRGPAHAAAALPRSAVAAHAARASAAARAAPRPTSAPPSTGDYLCTLLLEFAVDREIK